MRKWCFIPLLCLISSGLSANALSWRGTASASWNDPNNWSPMQLPSTGDDLTFPFSPIHNPHTLNDIPQLTFYNSITFGNPSYTISGNAVGIGTGVPGQIILAEQAGNNIFSSDLNLGNDLTINNKGQINSGITFTGNVICNNHSIEVVRSLNVTFNTLPTGYTTQTFAGDISIISPPTLTADTTTTSTGSLTAPNYAISSGGSYTSNGSTVATSGGMESFGSFGGGGSYTSPGPVNSYGGAVLRPSGFGSGFFRITAPEVVMHPGSTHETLIASYDSYGASGATTLQVNGAYTLQNNTTLHLIYQTSGVLQPGEVKRIVTATAGVTGTFATVTTTGFPFLITADPIYMPNEIDVVLTANPFSSCVCEGNAGKVAAFLDCITPCPDSCLADDILILQNAPTCCCLIDWLDQLQPSLYKALVVSQENNTWRVRDSILEHIGWFDQACCLKKRPKTEKKSSEKGSKQQTEDCDCNPTNDWDIWADFFADHMNQDHQHDKIGFHTQTEGLTVGADRKYDSGSVGAGLSYTYSNVHWNRFGKDGNLNSVYGSVFGTYFQKIFFMDFAGMVAGTRYEGARDIDISTIHRRAKFHEWGYEAFADLTVGANFTVKNVDINLFGREDYIFLHQNSFEEHGAADLNLDVEGSNYNVLRSEVGFQVLRCFRWTCSKLIPLIQFGVIRESRFGGKEYTARFEDTCSEFTVRGLAPSRWIYAPSFELMGTWCKDALSLSFRYDGEFGDDYMDNAGHVRFTYTF